MVHGMYQGAARFRSWLLSCGVVHTGKIPSIGPCPEQPDGVETVLTDDSSVAMGVVIQVNETLVEDESRLRRKSDDCLHINVAELEAVGRCVNLAIQWGFRSFTVVTDSRVVVSWLDNSTEVRDREGPLDGD